MKCFYFLLLVFFVSSCGIVQNTDQLMNEDSNKDSLFFEINKNVVKLSQYVMEGSSSCPKFELLSKDKKQVVDSLEICLIKISGYREFHVTKDFAYIEFNNFQLINGRINYHIDLAIRRGSAFLINCEVSIQNQKLIQGDCKKI